MATLKVTSGPLAGQAIELEDDVVIGRETGDLVVPDAEVSRRHAAVRSVPDGVEVEDFDSLNGTFVNGERIEGTVMLTKTGALRIGNTEFAVDIPVAQPDVTAPRAIQQPDVTAPRSIPQPDVTAPRSIPQPDVTAPRSIPQPDVTAPRSIPQPDVTAPRSIPQPDVTAQRAVADKPDQPAPAEARGGLPFPPAVLAAIIGVVVAIVLLIFVLG
jgi:predicted component of type VI protein secretion system